MFFDLKPKIKFDRPLMIGLSIVIAMNMLSLSLLLLPNQVDAAPMAQADGVRNNITVTVLTQNDETTETLSVVDPDGNRFLNDGKTWIQIVNGYTATITVTFVTPAQIAGLAIADKDIVIDASSTSFAGPFRTSYFNQNTGTYKNYTYINYNSAVTGSVVNSVTVGAYRLP